MFWKTRLPTGALDTGVDSEAAVHHQRIATSVAKHFLRTETRAALPRMETKNKTLAAVSEPGGRGKVHDHGQGNRDDHSDSRARQPAAQ